MAKSCYLMFFIVALVAANQAAAARVLPAADTGLTDQKNVLTFGGVGGYSGIGNNGIPFGGVGAGVGSTGGPNGLSGVGGVIGTGPNGGLTGVYGTIPGGIGTIGGGGGGTLPYP